MFKKISFIVVFSLAFALKLSNANALWPFLASENNLQEKNIDNNKIVLQDVRNSDYKGTKIKDEEVFVKKSQAVIDPVKPKFDLSDKTDNLKDKKSRIEQNSGIILWNSKQGLELLESAKYKADFYQLANFYQPQINPLYCGVASSVIILNVIFNGQIENQAELSIAKPDNMGGGLIEYHLYSQLNFLNNKTDKIKKREIIDLKIKKITKDNKEIYDPGLMLTELAQILKDVYKLKVKTIYAQNKDEKSLQKFRNDLKKYLADEDNFILVNFDGKILATNTAGHISPVAAYDEKTDMVLVLDVALHKGMQWYFVSVPKLYEAMNSKDLDQYRGYLVLSK